MNIFSFCTKNSVQKLSMKFVQTVKNDTFTDSFVNYTNDSHQQYKLRKLLVVVIGVVHKGIRRGVVFDRFNKNT